MRNENYSSGDDFIVEFVGYRFCFNAADFEQRSVLRRRARHQPATRFAEGSGPYTYYTRLDLPAPVRGEIVRRIGESFREAKADLVELVADGRIADPRSNLGRYLLRNWEKLAARDGESLVYWLRKIVFRGAWLDHRVKERLLEIAWDDEQAEFAYRDPRGGRALLELAPVPSWQQLQFRR